MEVIPGKQMRCVEDVRAGGHFLLPSDHSQALGEIPHPPLLQVTAVIFDWTDNQDASSVIGLRWEANVAPLSGTFIKAT